MESEHRNSNTRRTAPSRGRSGRQARRYADDAGAERSRRLRSLHDRLDIREVEEIYLPLSRLLSLYVEATQELFIAQKRFLGIPTNRRCPTSSASRARPPVGKSTTARVLQALLKRWPPKPKVDLVTTDGFLLSDCGARARRADAEEGFPRKLRPAGAAVVPERHQGRAPPGARADLFAHHLRHRAERMGRRSTAPTS